VQERLYDEDFVSRHCARADELFARLADVPVRDFCDRAGVDEADVRSLAQRIASASSVALLEDLGIQQAPHSTLDSYLEKLIVILTGNLGVRGGVNIHTRLAGLGGGGGHGRKSPVTGSRIITGLLPCNVIPDEILTDHPSRFRALVVESGNPVHSLADSRRMREALEALELVVVIDVAWTETARLADYVLPAASQLEKWEATFFTLDFPANHFHLRAPLFEPRPGTLAEPEIHRRLARALGALEGEDLSALRAAAEGGLSSYAKAFLTFLAERPELKAYVPLVLYETLGPRLPAGASAAAVLWGAAQTCALTWPDSVRRAGFEGEGPELGNALFEAILRERSGVVFTLDEYADTLRRLETEDGRVNLAIPELLSELAGLRDEPAREVDAEYPFVLSAGERRGTTANTIYRDPGWPAKAGGAALRIHPDDAERLGIADGAEARITTRRGSFVTSIERSDRMQPGHVSLPNGLGLVYPDADGTEHVYGVPPNELTASEDRDWLAGTPFHKHVRARVEAVRG